MGKKNDLTPVKGEPLESIDPEATEEVKLDSDEDTAKAESKAKAPESKTAAADKLADKATDKANDSKDDKEKTKDDKADKDKATAVTKDKESDTKAAAEKATTEEVKASDKTSDKESKPKEKEEAAVASEKSQKAELNEEDAPPMPKRPVDPVQQLKDELLLAFPDADAKLVTTVLVASQGNLEHAFSALLYYFDPLNPADIPVPAPAALAGKAAGQAPAGLLAAGAKYGLLTEDEILARKLQQQFEEEDRQARQQRRSRRLQQQQPRQRLPREQYDYDDDSYDEIEQIKETFTQGFEEAKTTINGWMLGLSKKLEEFSQGDEPQDSRQQYQGPLFGALGGSAGNDTRTLKREGNRVQFDEDPVQITELHLPLIRMNNNEKMEKQPTTAAGAAAASAASDKKWQPLDANSDKFQVDLDED